MILTFGVLLAASCIYLHQAEKQETRTWPGSGITEIQASTKNGAITVTGVYGPDITALITRRCWGSDEDDAEKHLADIVVSDGIANNRLTIRAEMPSGSTRNYGAEFAIVAPLTTGLDLKTSNAKVVVSGIAADVRISTSNGAVTTEHTQGRLILETSNGAVNVQDQYGPVEALTSNGALDCDLAGFSAGDAANLETSNGAVDVHLPADISADFDLATSNGRIEISDFSAIHYDQNDATRKRGTIGDGGPLITVHTSNGRVSIRAR